ncbi:AAA family ATPase [Candidatus Woesearchaeota archaeon]|nr:AAA family ATPase [Candidatus Woesearchaeota archaeon]
MGLFDEILHDNESLFSDEIALDYDYIPKEIPFREQQQHFIASCITPLINNKTGRNLFIHGAPGIGKTLAALYVKRELEEKYDNIYSIYVNCWKKDTSYKILIDICEQIGYKWTHNKRTDELMKIITNILNKKSCVIFLDEADRVKELDILYSFCEDLIKKSIILIANDKNWFLNLDNRVKSRLVPELLEFQPYNSVETASIMRKRASYAFSPSVWEEEAIQSIINKTIEMQDIRSGLFLLREAGNIAESKASRKIKKEHAEKALSKLTNFKIKNSKDFSNEEQRILELVKNNSGKTIKEIHDSCKNEFAYRTFFRKLEELEKANMIEIVEVPGKSSIVNYAKKLTDF